MTDQRLRELERSGCSTEELVRAQLRAGLIPNADLVALLGHPLASGIEPRVNLSKWDVNLWPKDTLSSRIWFLWTCDCIQYTLKNRRGLEILEQIREGTFVDENINLIGEAGMYALVGFIEYVKAPEHRIDWLKYVINRSRTDIKTAPQWHLLRCW